MQDSIAGCNIIWIDSIQSYVDFISSLKKTDTIHSYTKLDDAFIVANKIGTIRYMGPAWVDEMFHRIFEIHNANYCYNDPIIFHDDMKFRVIPNIDSDHVGLFSMLSIGHKNIMYTNPTHSIRCLLERCQVKLFALEV